MPFQTSLGIDIERDRVSVACLKTSVRGVKLAAHGTYEFEEARPTEEKVMGLNEFIRGFIRNHRVNSADVFIAVPRDMAMLRYILLPSAAKENLRATLQYEMEKYVPLSVEDIYFDYQVIAEEKETGMLKILLLVVRRESIAPYFSLLYQLGGGISGMEITSTALANWVSARPDMSEGDGMVLAYGTRSRLELNLIRNGQLHYSRSVAFGEINDKTGSLIRQELQAIKEAVGQDSGRLHVLLCLAESQMKVMDSLREEADLDVVPMDLSAADLPSHTLMPACGLAVRGMQKVPMNVNLLPAEFRKKPNRVGYYSMVILMVLFLVSLAAWGGSHMLRQRIYLDRLNTEIKTLSAEIAEINAVKASSQKVEAQIDYLLQIRQSRTSVLDVLKELSLLVPESAWVRSLTISEKGVQIQGYADSASELIPSLEASPLFKDVAFLSRITKSKDGKEQFRIGLQIN